MRLLRPLFDRFVARPDSQRAPGPEGLDLLSADFLADPYPFYAYLRQNEPVHRTKQGSWLLTGHAMQVEAFSNPALGNAPSKHAVIHARNAAKYTSASVAENILPFLDRPRQIKPRRVLGTVFRAAMRDMPLDLEAIATSRLQQLRSQAQIDLIADYAEPLSVSTISHLMGLPESDAGQLSRWAEGFFYLFAPMPSHTVREETDASLDQFRAYLRDLLRQRRASPGSDIVSRLLVTEENDGPLSDEEIVDNCMLLFADGVENVDRGFANTMLALHWHPDARAQLRADPSLSAAAIAEGLRYDPPGQVIARIARDDVQLGRKMIKKDSAVLLGVASANRDPAAFSEPDRYQLSRHGDDLLTFGRGRHSCIGAPLVQQEMEAAMRALIATTKRVNLDTASLTWEPRFGHRWLKALPARLSYC